MGFTNYLTATPEAQSLAELLDTAIKFQRSGFLVSGCRAKIADAINSAPDKYPGGVTPEMDKFISGIGGAVDAGIATWIGWTPPYGGTLPAPALQHFVDIITEGWSGSDKDKLIGKCGQAIYELIMTGQ